MLWSSYAGWTRVAMSGRQVHNSYAVTSLFSHLAGGRHVPAGREGVSDRVQHVGSAAVHGFRPRVRQRSQRYAQGDVSARKHPHDSRPDLPHVLDLG